MSEEHKHQHHHHGSVSEKSVKYLMLSFIINILLSVAEIVGGILAGSISLIGDALHNTSDAFSILIAVIAFKIGKKKATQKYTYGFKRAEIIGGFVNLVLLFISGVYLFFEGVLRLISPEKIDGMVIIVVSVLALIVDVATAKISHHDAHHNTNMRMVFLHNLADAFGSLGVIVSGLCVLAFGVYRVDGVIALLIAIYMVFQSVVSFPKIVNILMNAAPEGLDVEQIKKRLLALNGIKGVHHIHVWQISEDAVSLECHVEADDMEILPQICNLLHQEFDIEHCNIQIEKCPCKQNCCLEA